LPSWDRPGLITRTEPAVILNRLSQVLFNQDLAGEVFMKSSQLENYNQEFLKISEKKGILHSPLYTFHGAK